MRQLQVIDDGARTGAENMAADSRLLAEHRPGMDPILRVYSWSPPAISLGYNQPDDSFDRDAATRHGYDLVRRPTGGRAILHAQELTYAVIGSSPSNLFGDSLHQSYRVINDALLEFLGRLGIAAEVSCGETRVEARGLLCFASAGQYEIHVAGRKLIGSAQRRTGNVFLQHGSILTGPRHADLPTCLDSAAPDQQRRRLLAATTDLGQLLGRAVGRSDYRRLSDHLIAAFGATFGLPPTISAQPAEHEG